MMIINFINKQEWKRDKAPKIYSMRAKDHYVR